MDYILDYGLVNITRGTESGGEYSFDQMGFDEKYGNITGIYIGSYPIQLPGGGFGPNPWYFSSIMLK